MVRGGDGKEESTAAAAATAAPVVKKKQSRFVVRDLDAEDVVPGLSDLSIADDRRTDASDSCSAGQGKVKTSSSRRVDGGVGGDDGSNNTSGPVASRTRGKEREREAGGRGGEAPPRPADAAATPPKPSAGRQSSSSSSSPSPTLSRYGVALDYEPPSEQDVLAHGLHLAWESGDDEDAPAATTAMVEQEREALVRPWTEVGALISWLPGGRGAVAMFCSVPTAQRAARKVSSSATGIRVRAAPLLSCDPEIRRQALACGLAIPARPKADTAAASRLIVGALGMRSPSSSRPPIGGTTPQGTKQQQQQQQVERRRTPVTRSQGKDSQGSGGGEGSGVGGD